MSCRRGANGRHSGSERRRRFRWIRRPLLGGAEQAKGEALSAVSKTCAKGKRVVFDGPDSYIEHKTRGARAQTRESRGIYVVDMAPGAIEPEEHEPQDLGRARGEGLAHAFEQGGWQAPDGRTP